MRERLRAVYGDEWWEQGVMLSLSPQQKENVQKTLDRPDVGDPLSLLDAPHFTWIISTNRGGAFQDAFGHMQGAFQDLRAITYARNQWAHVQDMPTARVTQTADRMKHVLASLRCEEALEIDRLSQEFDMKAVEGIGAEDIPDIDDPDDAPEVRESAITPWALWRSLQSYLVLSKTVTLPNDESAEPARVVVKAHNVAPDGADWPEIHFSSVIIRASIEPLDVRHDGYSYGGSREWGLASMSPGETREVEFHFRAKQLMDVEFEARCQIDTAKLFQFKKITYLPEEIVGQIRQEFVESFGRIGIREYVNGALAVIEAIDPDMTLADMSRIRESLKSLPEQVGRKQAALEHLFNESGFDRQQGVGLRMVELVQKLNEFASHVSALDQAMGQTDLELIDQAVHDLKQVQLAVIRVEDSIRTINTNP